jgi:hypothetical protein
MNKNIISMKTIKVIALFFVAAFTSCLGNRGPVEMQEKERIKILDITKFSSSIYTGNEFSGKLSTVIGYVDTIFFEDGIVILKTNIKEIDRGEYNPLITIRKLSLIVDEQNIFERGNLINIGDIVYHKEIGVITLPLIYDLENESFSTTCDLLIYNTKEKKLTEIGKGLTDLSNAFISSDSSIYYMANNSIFCYKKNQTKELAHFENAYARFFIITLLNDRGFRIVYCKDFPEDTVDYETIIPFDSIFSN